MKTKTIARVNNVAILAGNDSEKLVPIKPICEALGIDRKAQQDKIREDEFLSSVGVLSTATGADGKQYEMFCLPLEFIFGWLFTINPKNVKEEAQEAVRQYRIECYRVLYNHFFGNLKKQIEQNDKEIRLLEEITELSQQKTAILSSLSEKKRLLEKLREERLKNEPELF